MQQLLLNISDSSKANELLRLLSTLNYVKIEPYTEENIVVSDSEINLMRERVNNAKPEDFKSWDEFIASFEVQISMKKYTINILPKAQDDFRDAVKYYRDIDEKLAKRFVKITKSTVNDLKKTAMYQIKYDQMRLRIIH